MRARPHRLAVAALSVAALAACSRPTGELPAGTAAGAPVVLISIDTLRSDRLPAYGYRNVETPAIDGLRRDAVLFERAYSHMPLTLPSHASIFTGLLPPEHGVRDNIGYRVEGDLPYLPRLLKQAGYATGGAVSAFVLRADTGMASGFDFYDAEVQSLTWTGQLTAQRAGAETLELARGWLASLADERFFLFFHIYEPHTPRRPPKRFAERFADPYDGEVAAADEIVGDLLAELRRRGLYDRALIVLLSDHGEGLEDHGEDEHGVLLYRESLQVPLIVKLPGGRGGGSTRGDVAGLADITPTVLHLLGLDVPDGLAGRALFAEQPAEPPPVYAETLYPRLHFGWSELTSLIDYPHHLIRGPDPELYDLEADPAERDNLIRRQQRLAAAMSQRLAGYDRPFESPAEADPEVARQLAALGYIGSVAAAADDEGPLADPKERVHVLQELRGAFSHMSRGEYRQAVAAFREALAEEPRMVDSWGQLGHALMALGEYGEALEAFQRAFELSGGAARLALSVSNALFKLGRYDEAEAHIELAVAAGENAYELAARLALARGRLDEAERQIAAGLKRSGGRAALMILEAQIALERGRLEEAVSLTDRVLADWPEEADPRMLAGLYFVRGEALAQLGEAEQAEAAFRREIEIAPTELATYGRLAVLYALLGRPQDAAGTLRKMLDGNPRPAAFLEAIRTLEVLGDRRSAAIVRQEGLRRWPDNAELRAAG